MIDMHCVQCHVNLNTKMSHRQDLYRIMCVGIITETAAMNNN
jgi:hypothetical protein